MKVRVQVTVNKQTTWAEWKDESSEIPKLTYEQECWVRERAQECLRRSMGLLSRALERM